MENATREIEVLNVSLRASLIGPREFATQSKEARPAGET